MKKFFVHDNNSVHGTFIGNNRLGREPKALIKGNSIIFGASTRNYILKKGGGHESEGDKNETGIGQESGKSGKTGSGLQKQVLAGDLPKDQVELDQLTDKNTQMNLKHAANLANLPLKLTNTYKTSSSLSGGPAGPNSKRKNRKRVNFQSSTLLEQVINIHEIDEKIGKFKNLVNSTEIIDEKKILTMAKKSNLSKKPKLSLGMFDAELDVKDMRDPNLPRVEVTVVSETVSDAPETKPEEEVPETNNNHTKPNLEPLDPPKPTLKRRNILPTPKFNLPPPDLPIQEPIQPLPAPDFANEKSARLSLIEQLEKEAEMESLKNRVKVIEDNKI